MAKKKSKIKLEPVENLSSTWEGFCIMMLSEMRTIRNTLKQIKGILAEIRDKQK